MRSLILFYGRLGAKVDDNAERLVRFLGERTEPVVNRVALLIAVALTALGVIAFGSGPLAILAVIGAYMAASLWEVRS